MTAFPVGHQGGNKKCAIGAKLRGREDIAIATWNVRTLRAAGKVEELLHEMDRYKWSILGLCEMRWKKSGEITTDGGHRVYLHVLLGLYRQDMFTCFLRPIPVAVERFH